MSEIDSKFRLKKGYIHYLYGNGQGKTTSALGITIRALGHGLKPLIIQFLKKSIDENIKNVSQNSYLPNFDHVEIDFSELIRENFGDISLINTENLTNSRTGFIIKQGQGFNYGEYNTLKNSLKIPIIQLGTPDFVYPNKGPTELQVKLSKFGMNLIEVVSSKDRNNPYDIVVLDEIITAVELKLVDVKELVNLLKNKRDNVEIILTGREKNLELMNISDYITQFVEEKHPFQKGIKARKGIEF